MASTVQEYTLHDEDNTANIVIGRRYLHKGGNIWTPLRFAYVYVQLTNPDYIADIGPCVFLRCSGSTGEMRFTIKEFWDNFSEL